MNPNPKGVTVPSQGAKRENRFAVRVMQDGRSPTLVAADLTRDEAWVVFLKTIKVTSRKVELSECIGASLVRTDIVRPEQ